MRERVAWAMVWLLAALAAATVIMLLLVGLWRFGSVAMDEGWLAAWQSVDLRGVGLAAGGLATMVGVAIAALVGYYKFQLFREGRPHLTIDLTASHRPVSPRHIHIGVTARLANTSKVMIEVQRCVWRLSFIAPYSAAVMDEKVAEFAGGGGNNNQWDELGWRMLSWPETQNPDLEIEPGETDEITYDFIIATDVESVAIRLAVANEYYQESGYETASGYIPQWYRRIFYDVTTR